MEMNLVEMINLAILVVTIVVTALIYFLYLSKDVESDDNFDDWYFWKTGNMYYNEIPLRERLEDCWETAQNQAYYNCIAWMFVVSLVATTMIFYILE